MEDYEKNIEIPFGAKDSELGGFEYTIPEGYEAEIKDGKVIVRKTESEDERMRKELIKAFKEFLKQNNYDKDTNFKGVNIKKAIAWLEKQGEQKPVNEEIYETLPLSTFEKARRAKEALGQVTYLTVEESRKIDQAISDALGLTINGIEEASKKEMLQRQNPVETKPHLPDGSIPYDRRFEEAQEYLSKRGFDVPWNDCDVYVDERHITQTVANVLTWADEHPARPWNKQDIEMIDWLIRCCEEEHKELCNDRYGHQEIVSDLKRDCRKKWDWLESLKNKVVPQNRWKPTEEQMWVLSSLIKEASENELPIINSLYYELQKL